MIYYVSKNGCDSAPGTQEAPFLTINRAASVAAPGDTVRVYGGVYREWVDPKCGGLNELTRITYEAVPGEKVVIKGSEIVTDWESVNGTVWKAVLPNAMFGDWNPYVQRVWGDWMEGPLDHDVHLGDVYIDGVSMFEASSMEDLYEAPIRTQYVQNALRFDTEYVKYPELTAYRWFAQVDDKNTTIFCNFQKVDPNASCIEINVRKCCFYPTQSGLNYITIRGFEFAQAACPFTPPTSDQVGMVGPNWSKGWIIENNHVHDAKCSGISLGKDGTTGDNLSSKLADKSGHIHQMESMFLGLYNGWSKERIGSHIVRNNVIHDCGQNGIVGHMGCAFSLIEHNHIYNISIKREYWGHEMGGIKFHAPIDTVIVNNNIHDCGLGIWLDWQSQGTRLTRNIFHHNDRDLMIEVTHGPCVVDHNILLSNFALDNHAQGTAIVHNLIAGVMRPRKILNRNTPYHFPHSTFVAGFTPVLGGDDRVMNNIFLGVQEERGKTPNYSGNFCKVYDEFSTPEEYPQRIAQAGLRHTTGTYMNTPQAVWIDGNAYAGHAGAFRGEENSIRIDGAQAAISEEDGQWILTLSLPESIAAVACEAVTTERLGAPRITQQPYDDAIGNALDYSAVAMDGACTEGVIPGPFAKLTPGKTRIVVWK